MIIITKTFYFINILTDSPKGSSKPNILTVIINLRHSCLITLYILSDTFQTLPLTYIF